MDLHFEPTGGRAPFSMKVGSFDTIQDIKEKIQKCHNIPVEKQTLFFNDQTLSDDLNIHPCVDNSHIRLIITGDQESTPPPQPATPATNLLGGSMENMDPFESRLLKMNPFDDTFLEDGYGSLNFVPPENPTTTTFAVNQESTPPLVTPASTTSSEFGSSMNIAPPPPPPATPSKKITLILKIPTVVIRRIPKEFEINDSVRRLKEKINEIDKELPVEKLIVRSNGVELHDHNTLHECGLLDHSEIEVSLKRSSAATSSSKATKNNNNNSNNNNNRNSNKPKIPRILKAPKILKIWVATMNGTKTFPLEVNACDKVKELRKELEPLNLSQEEFFFIYKHNVMEEDKSFEWHNIKQGDNIEIITKTPKKMKIFVVTMYEKKTIPLEVNAWDKVGELRKELDKVNQREPLNLSQEGFFFIHGQAAMDEDKSFEWHNVQQGDKIDIFNGTITKGSQSSS